MMSGISYKDMKDSEIFHLRGEAHHPWHLYVGVLLSDKDGRVAIATDSDGTRIFPRETITTDEELLRTVHRLILEQIGVRPEVRMYLGSHTTAFDRYDGTVTEKTILYFVACFDETFYEKFSSTLPEKEGVEWYAPVEAAALLAKQPWGEDALIARYTKAFLHL